MSGKLKLKDVEKHTIEQVLETATNGTVLKFVCGLKFEKIVFHVSSKSSNVIEVFHSLEQAIQRYNQLVE